MAVINWVLIAVPAAIAALLRDREPSRIGCPGGRSPELNAVGAALAAGRGHVFGVTKGLGHRTVLAFMPDHPEEGVGMLARVRTSEGPDGDVVFERSADESREWKITGAVAPEVRAAQRRIVGIINASGRLNALPTRTPPSRPHQRPYELVRDSG
ncbi:hypothetical protein [Streptomyces sp. NPDC002599]|uniref:hypothetical protein n=1 Tax=Streptomyces sp. NPDC002599 TaxID=3154421 RepID=UPI0033175C75